MLPHDRAGDDELGGEENGISGIDVSQAGNQFPSIVTRDDISGNHHTSNDAYDIENKRNESEAKESRSLLPFCIVFGFGSLFSSSLQTYMSSQITVLERAFGMNSETSGILLSANDIGFVVTVLFASHFLHRHHIPRILGTCILIFGISGALTSLPHFIMNEKMGTQGGSVSNASNNGNDSFLCRINTSISTTRDSCDNTSSSSSHSTGNTAWVLWWFAAMMVIQGIAKASRQPLSTTYLDNNSKKERTGFYIGVVSTFGIFGPMIAITAGGLFSKLPVDLQETTLVPEDPRWIGAWWIGFLVFGACAFVISLPIFCFPAGRREPLHKATTFDKNDTDEDGQSCCQYFKDLPRSIGRVFSSPVYTLNLIATALQLFSIMALASFGPKYLEQQFNIPTWKANLIIGPEKLVTTVLGTFCGGLLTRRLKLDVTGCVKLTVIARAISLVLKCFNFLLGCDNPPIIGLDAVNRFDSNVSCDCSGVQYLPVCSDTQTYFSPCHAGCQVETSEGFGECLGTSTGDVMSGICETGCPYLIPFVVVNAISALSGTLVIAPLYVIVLRSVKERDRSMAVGLTSFVLSLLVFLPAPIVYGKLFDSLCLMWTNSCDDEKGSCSLYDVTGIRVNFNATDVGLRIVSVFFTVLLLYVSSKQPRQETTIIVNEDKESGGQRKNGKDIHTNGHTAFKLSDINVISGPETNTSGHIGDGPNKCDGGGVPMRNYVNFEMADQEQWDPNMRHKPLPPLPDKPPKPSPRLSRI